MSLNDKIKIFSPKTSHHIAEKISALLGCSMEKIEQQQFPENGEFKYRPVSKVTNKDVFIIHSIYGDDHHTVHDKLCELLFLTATLKDDFPKSVTIIAPYLCYMRKDRQVEVNDPVTTKYIARLIESVGADCIVTIDVHNLSAFQNAFRCHSVHLEAAELFADHFAKNIDGPITVVSPDLGGMKRAEKFRQALHKKLNQEVEIAFMIKERHDSIRSVSFLNGNVRNRNAIIVDDIISSGSTMGHAIRACKSEGAAEIHLTASHGLFTADATKNISNRLLKSVVITNTVRPFRLDANFSSEKLLVLDISKLIADSILTLIGIYDCRTQKTEVAEKDSKQNMTLHH